VNAQGRKFRKSIMIPKDEHTPDIDAARKRLAELTKINAFDSLENALLKTKAQIEGVESARSSHLDSLPAMELEDIFDEYCLTRAGRKASDGTRRMYDCQFGRFVRWAKENHPEISEARQITRPVARQFSEHLLKTMSGNSHNKYMTLLSCIWKAIITKEEEENEGVRDFQGVIDVGEGKPQARLTMNPWSSIEKADHVTHTRRELTIEEIRNLINSTDGSWKTLIVTMLTTGLRLKDAVLLDFDSISLAEGIIRIRPYKVARKMAMRNEWTMIPILPDLRNILESVPENERKGYMVPDLAELYLHSGAGFNYHLTKIFKHAGLVGKEVGEHGRKVATISAHHLRHTFASFINRTLSANGTPNALSLVSTLLSHHSLGMTKRYVHQNADDLKAQVQDFPRLLHSDQSLETVEGSDRHADVGDQIVSDQEHK